MELSVWEIPQDVAGKKELPALQEACEQMRREHFYAKLAVPEVGTSGLSILHEAES